MKEDHATKITACASLLAGTALLVGAAGAAPIVGGIGDHNAVEASVGSVVTQTEAVAVSSAANGLAKRGDGTYVLPSDRLLLRDQFTLKTGAGTGEFRFVTSADGLEFPPPDAVADAAFWVDASREHAIATTVTTNVIANADGSETTNFVANAETWYDVRDLEAVTAGNAGTHPRAVASRALTFGDGETRAPSVETLDGRSVVNFGCGRTGRYMMWRTPDGGTNRIDGIRHLFAVQCITNSWGYLLGSHGNDSAKATPGSPNDSSLALVKGTPLWHSSNHAICSGRTFQNGVAVDGYTAKAKLGFHLLEFVTQELTVDGSDCFFNDHDYQASAATGGQGGEVEGNRVGGDFLSEVLVFTNRLTEAQRMAIEAHLMAKWRLQPEAPDVTLVTKDGTTTRVSTDGAAYDASVVGDGRLEIAGAATAYLQPMTDDRLVVASSPVTPRGGTADSGNEAARSTAAQDTAAFAGEARLAGAAYVNTPVPLVLEAGETVTANQDATGLCVRVTADAKSGSLVKRGRGEVSLARVPAAVSKLSVEEGVLRLVAPGRPTGLEASANVGIAADISNADWETAETGATVTVPADGVYELSFSCRRDGKFHDQPLYADVVLSSDTMGERTVGRAVCVKAKPSRFYRFRTPRLTAGAYALALRSAVAAAETSGAQFDGFRMVCVADEPDAPNALTNGDFEDFAWPLAAPGFSAAAIASAAAGWKFEQAADRAADAAPSVALVTPGAMDATSCYWDALGYRQGTAAVCFFKPGGTLTRTNLTLAAGAYRVRARLARQRHPWGYAGSAAAALTATVTPKGGTPIALGSVTQEARAATVVTWPAGFALTEPTAVDLAFAQTADTILIADDFEIVPTRDLLANGGFEQEVSTTSDDGNWMSEGDHVVRGWYGNATHDAVFSRSYFAGNNYMRIWAAGLVRQRVTFPVAGVYRLTLHGHAPYGSAADSDFSGNPLRAWWLQPQADGAVVTNEIGRTSFETQDEQSRNFLRFSWNFRVPEAGTYVLGLQGTGIRDATLLVDDVSLAWIDEAQVEAAPSADAELELRVAAGAKVRLDYPGALTVRKLCLGGKRVRATACDADGNRTVTVSAADYPDFFTGPGSVTVSTPSRGVLFILR